MNQTSYTSWFRTLVWSRCKGLQTLAIWDPQVEYHLPELFLQPSRAAYREVPMAAVEASPGRLARQQQPVVGHQ